METIRAIIDHELAAPDGTSFSAAHVVVARSGKVLFDFAGGDAARYSGSTRDALAPEHRPPVTAQTRFDIASLTKLLTAGTLLELLDRNHESVDVPAHRYLPELADGPRSEITLRHLLTHTAGYPPVWFGWRDRPSIEAARAAILALDLEAPPGQRHRYSCLGYILAGIVAERISGTTLDVLMRETMTDPLDMRSTGFRPAGPENTVATEFQLLPEQVVVHGRVHDETAWTLGGVAGNAGLFSTGSDLIRFAEELRTGDHGVLSPRTRAAMTTVQTPPGVESEYGQAIGSRLGHDAFMGALADGGIGHTGFTGTLLLVHPARELSLVALTNRVHPTRTVNDPMAFRRELAAALAVL